MLLFLARGTMLEALEIHAPGETPMEIHAFAGIELQDASGQLRDLHRVLRSQPTVLLFIRHFG